MTGYLQRGRQVLQEHDLRGLARKSFDHFLLQRGFLQFLGWYYRRNVSPSTDLPTVCRMDSAKIAYHSDFTQQQFPVTDSKRPESKPISGVYGGPWDRFRSKWSDSLVHQAIRARFVDGIPWEGTAQYQRAATVIQNGGKIWYSESMEDLQARTEFLENLHTSLQEHGYIPQTELHAYADAAIPEPEPSTKLIHGEEIPNECIVGIGRHGEIIRFTGAHHRISLAKVLGLSDIPVVVAVRHKRWQSIRETYRQASSLDCIPDRYSQFANHPDIPTPKPALTK